MAGPTALDDLMKALEPLARAMTVPGVGHVDPASVVILRNPAKPLSDWQCGGFTCADLGLIALAYHAFKAECARHLSQARTEGEE